MDDHNAAAGISPNPLLIRKGTESDKPFYGRAANIFSSSKSGCLISPDITFPLENYAQEYPLKVGNAILTNSKDNLQCQENGWSY